MSPTAQMLQVSDVSSLEAGVLTRLKAVLPQRANSAPPALVFHGVRGTNCQAEESPSWHNPHEAVQVAMYLQSLYDSGLTPDDCGIITPYQAQVSIPTSVNVVSRWCTI